MTWNREGIAWAGFSTDGHQLRLAGRNGGLAIGDPGTGQTRILREKLDNDGFADFSSNRDRGKVVGVAFPREANYGAAPRAGQIFLWDPSGTDPARPLREQVEPARYATLTPDSSFIVSTEIGGQIRVYDVVTGKLSRSFAGRESEYHPTFAPDGKLLATTASNGVLRLYDFATGHVLHEIRGITNRLAFSPDGRTLAAGNTSLALARQPSGQPGAVIYLWDVVTRRELRPISTGQIFVKALCFSPDSQLIAATGFDSMVRLWEVASGMERLSFIGHQSGVQNLDFAPDGRRLVSASSDGTALVWRVFDPAPAERSPADLELLWADLLKEGKTAHRAIAALIAARETPTFLTKRLKPAVKPSEEQVKRWLVDLGSPVFSAREAAQKDLARVAEQIEPLLRRALKTTADLEVQRRLTAVLDNLPLLETRPEQLRAARAVEVLGHIHAHEARQILAELAKGAPEASLTRQAKASLAGSNLSAK